MFTRNATSGTWSMAEHTIKMTCGQNVMVSLELTLIPIFIGWAVVFLASLALTLEEIGNDDVR